ncbi:MAG: type II toxin-antitoxin system Phd/YefM family antitoxin [Thermodesulfobacteriota bacterium]
MKKTITAMYARKNFGQILDKAALLDESYVIERSGRPMAALVPLTTLDRVEEKVDEIDEALENLIGRIKGSRSKKLEKAIARARTLVAGLHR